MLRRERPVRIRSIVSLTVLVVVVTLASRAEASPSEVNLTWSAPAGCPGRSQVLERIQQIRGSSVAEASSVAAEAVIEKRNGYELVMTTRRGDATQTRTAVSASCSTLGEAAAIIVAVALDEARANVTRDAVPEKEPEPREPPRAAEAPLPSPPTPPPPPPPPEDHVTRPPARAPAPSRASFGLGAAGLFDVGTLPNPTFGFQFLAAVTLARVQLGLAGSILAEGEQKYANESRAGVRFDVVEAGGFACWSPVGDRLRVGGCAQADVTLMKFEAFGIRQPGSARILWPTLRVGPMVELAVARGLFFFGRADASFAIAVPRVVLTTLNDNVALHEVSVPSFRLSLGLRGNFL